MGSFAYLKLSADEGDLDGDPHSLRARLGIGPQRCQLRVAISPMDDYDTDMEDTDCQSNASSASSAQYSSSE